MPNSIKALENINVFQRCIAEETRNWQLLSCIMQEQTFTFKINQLSTKMATLEYLLNELEDIGTPPMDSIDVDSKKIIKNAKVVNNGPKHDGTIPDPGLYKSTLEEVRKIIRYYIDDNAELEVIDDSVYGVEKAWYEILENTSEFNSSYSFVVELDDSFDTVFIDIDRKDELDSEKCSRIAFYKGIHEISWYGLREHFDVIQPEQKKIEDKIVQDMEDRGRILRKIYYVPGIGGTTLMRRLAWEFREKYPTFILNRLNEQTGKNLQKNSKFPKNNE